ncbi:MAG: GNAT family N-acetyltransferase [Lachnospiraceae bacterium]|nr:GNAT family N-acetyltransferase [Lachnospiraceae bacterium]
MNMKLRDFKREDAQVIAGWIKSEDDLYKWSADRYNKYPLSGNDINENYASLVKTERFYPFSAVDDKGDLIGHFIIRYPREEDDSRVRFGFVIISPKLRKMGYGKEMLKLGIEYVKANFEASRIDLGVFENNESARHCYEAVGFKEYATEECIMPKGTVKCIFMEISCRGTWSDK